MCAGGEGGDGPWDKETISRTITKEEREVMQRLPKITSALLPADDTPQRPSPVQPLQMSFVALSH